MAEENSPNPELAPENPEFEEYQENSISTEPDSSLDGHQTSYPTPFLIFIWVFMNTYCPYAEGPIFLAYYFSFLAFIPVLDSLNVYWKEKSPELPDKLLTAGQIILLMAGIFFFFIILLGTLFLE